MSEECVVFESGCSHSSFNGKNGDCGMCRYYPSNFGSGGNYFKPDANCKFKIHPIQEQLNKEKKISRRKENLEKRLNRDKDRSKVIKKAARQEKKTSAIYLRATTNSGRLNQDGDFKLGDALIDIKYQSTRLNPVILLEEFNKVGADCKRNGYIYPVLILRNSSGVGFAVLDEFDYYKLVNKE